ncbi:TonB-dependent receptor domain-containing protein [Sphingomonas sp. ERG5]|uniref:TonB-dependent receptor domain-containing protein n=1 Tax=Sphingomonas sp. ERG5 TaxID=1381597 RepID=UPI00054BD2A9|nr:TonB-dependent receptor [Sphingomonas sp. ERG5]
MQLKSILRCGTLMPLMLVLDMGVAHAQAITPSSEQPDAAQPSVGEDIVVTGSRIRRDPLDQDTPTVVLDQSALAQTGLTSVADILQRLPSAGGGLNSKVNNSGNIGNPPDGGGVGAGSSEIDLRYLGAKRTLVLVDGLRYVAGSSGSGIPSTVDINTIPASQIERIEVLQSGASPLYGSDAIAGVVNIITKSQQRGLQVSAQIGSYRQGDGHTQDYNASYGIKGPTTSIVFGASYVKTEAVRAGDRKISLFPNPGQTSCTDPVGGCSSGAVNGRFLGFFGNLALTHAPINGRPRYDPVNPANSDFRAFTAADRFNFAPFNYILTPSDRYGGFISAKQELTSSINLRVKAVYQRRNSQNQAAFLPLFVGPDGGNGNLLDTISIDATNPYNPFGVTLSAGGPGNPPANYSFVARRLVEAGQRTYTQKVDTMSLTGTLDGSFDVGGHKWYWDVNAVLGLNDAHQLFTGNVNSANLARALGPVANCTGPCVPFNIFGGAGSVTPAMLAYVGFDERDKSSQLLNDYTANLSGELFDLPAGPVGFAIGYEHRYQKADFIPDPVIVAGLGSDIPSDPARGSYNADEIFAEVRVPLLKDKPFFHSLEIDGAVRHSNYSISGSNTSYTGSVAWKPMEDFLLRGSYATGFRAPGLGELFGGRTRFDQPTTDPCSNIPGSPYAGSATVRANCAANGVPTDGSYAEPPGQLPVITSGNVNLKPEKSRSMLFGAVYSPRWARNSGGNLSLEANYYDIRVSNAISAIDANITLNNCALSGNAASCALVKRTANGFVSQINGVLQNIDTIRTRGIDLAINYRTPPTGFGTFGLSANGSYMLEYKLIASNGFLTIDRRGTERGSPDQAYPKIKGNATIDWSLSDFNVSFTGRYVDGVIESQNANPLASRFYGDVQLSYAPSWILDGKVSLTAGVNNVFNQDPPGCISCGLNNFDPTTYDVPGQFGYLRLSYKM